MLINKFLWGVVNVQRAEIWRITANGSSVFPECVKANRLTRLDGRCVLIMREHCDCVRNLIPHSAVTSEAVYHRPFAMMNTWQGSALDAVVIGMEPEAGRQTAKQAVIQADVYRQNRRQAGKETDR